MKRKSEYDNQAEQFAKKCGLTMKSIYTGHRARFGNHVTAVYSVTLSRPGKKSYTFDFSTSIDDSWEYVNRSTRERCKGLPPGMKLDSMFKALEGKEARIINGHAVRQTRKRPSVYIVLACLEKSEPMFFEEWCADYCYDSDSRKAFEIYEASQKESLAVIRLFADCMDELEEIH